MTEEVPLLTNDVLQVAPLSGSSMVQVALVVLTFQSVTVSYDKATCILSSCKCSCPHLSCLILLYVS